MGRQIGQTTYILGIACGRFQLTDGGTHGHQHATMKAVTWSGSVSCVWNHKLKSLRDWARKLMKQARYIKE